MGLGVANCPAVTGQCGFAVASLDDGTRGNANDYVDCMLCDVDQAVAGMLANSYATAAAPPLASGPEGCQATLGKASITFESKRLKLLQKCRKLQSKGVITGVCPDPGTLAKIVAAQAKLAATVAGGCDDATVTGRSGSRPAAGHRPRVTARSPPRATRPPASTARIPPLRSACSWCPPVTRAPPVPEEHCRQVHGSAFGPVHLCGGPQNCLRTPMTTRSRV